MDERLSSLEFCHVRGIMRRGDRRTGAPRLGECGGGGRTLSFLQINSLVHKQEKYPPQTIRIRAKNLQCINTSRNNKFDHPKFPLSGKNYSVKYCTFGLEHSIPPAVDTHHSKIIEPFSKVKPSRLLQQAAGVYP